MGPFDALFLDGAEGTVKYHPLNSVVLTTYSESSRWTLLSGQFDWGGRLLNGNGGVQRSARSE